MKKKIFMFLLTTTFGLSVIPISSVSAQTIQTDINSLHYDSSYEELKNRIVDIVRNSKTDTERDELLENLLSQNPLNLNTDANLYTINEAPIETVKVNEDTSIDFYSNGSFGILELEKLDTPSSSKSSYSASKYTAKYRGSYTLKSILGTKIVETYVIGYFKYDGSNIPTGYFVDAGYDKGFLSMWNCNSWNTGTSKDYSRNLGTVYAKGYYSWGIDLSVGNGNASGSGGITFADSNVLVRLVCDKNGNVKTETIVG